MKEQKNDRSSRGAHDPQIQRERREERTMMDETFDCVSFFLLFIFSIFNHRYQSPPSLPPSLSHVHPLYSSCHVHISEQNLRLLN